MNIIRTFLFSLILLPTFTYADMGSCYCMKVELETKQDIKHTGYLTLLTYDLYIEKQNDAYFYFDDGKKELMVAGFPSPFEMTISNEENMFFDYVFSIIRDSVFLYSDVINVRYEGRNNQQLQIPKLIGNKITVAKHDIKDFKVIMIGQCSVGSGISTKLTIDDKSWIAEAKLVDNQFIGGNEICSYQIFVYDVLNEAASSKVEEFKELLELDQSYAQNSNSYSRKEIEMYGTKITAMIQELKKYRIVVSQACAC